MPPDSLDAVRKSLVRTAMFVFTRDDGQPIAPARHHELISWCLERDWLGHTAIDAPPGHAKTYWGGNFFSAWRLGNDPSQHVMYVSASHSHATRQSVAVRNVIEHSREYHILFPHVRPAKANGWGELEWYLQRPSVNDPSASFLAAGRDTKVLGSRANLLILDDVNDQEEQRSDTQRQNTLDTVSATFMSRLLPGGRVICIQTRWHRQDVIGWATDQRFTHLHTRALSEDATQTAWLTIWDDTTTTDGRVMTGAQRLTRVKQELTADNWTFSVEEQGSTQNNDRRWVLEIVLHQRGPALWPEFYPRERIENDRRRLGPIAFANMYQNEPVPEGGAIIPVTRFRTYQWTRPDALPRFTHTIQAWDTAFSRAATADYSVCTTWGMTDTNEIYLIDLFRQRIDFPSLKRALVALHDRYRPTAVLVEDAASGKSLLQELRAMGGVPLIAKRPQQLGTDKVSRASSVTPYIDAGMVYIPDQAPWVEKYREELALFPNGDKDDQVDSTTLGLRYLIDSRGTSMRRDQEYWGTGTILGNIMDRIF